MSIKFPQYETLTLSPIMLPLLKLNRGSERLKIANAPKTGSLVLWSPNSGWKNHCFIIKISKSNGGKEKMRTIELN